MLDMPTVPGLPRGLAHTSADRVVPGLPGNVRNGCRPFFLLAVGGENFQFFSGWSMRLRNRGSAALPARHAGLVSVPTRAGWWPRPWWRAGARTARRAVLT